MIYMVVIYRNIILIGYQVYQCFGGFFINRFAIVQLKAIFASISNTITKSHEDFKFKANDSCNHTDIFRIF